MWPNESPGNSGKETRLVSEIFEDYDDKENKRKKDKFRETCAQTEYEIKNLLSIWNHQLIKWYLYRDLMLRWIDRPCPCIVLAPKLTSWCVWGEYHYLTVGVMRAVGKKGMIPFQRGIQLNIRSLLMLYQHLRAHSGKTVKYLMTDRINQDCLERFFGYIRSKRGGLNDHQSPLQF